MVLASEIYSGSDVVCAARGDGVNARLGGPGVRPAQGLRDARLVADVERVIEILEDILTGSGVGCTLARGQRELNRNEVSADLLLQLFPACGAGPGGIGGPDAAEGGLGWFCGGEVRPKRRQKRQRCQMLEQCASVHNGVRPKWWSR